MSKITKLYYKFKYRSIKKYLGTEAFKKALRKDLR